MAITYSETIDTWYQLGNLLWGGARDRWREATVEQCKEVYQRIEDLFGDMESSIGEVPSLTSINDYIWFECDDIFYPEEEEEEAIDE